MGEKNIALHHYINYVVTIVMFVGKYPTTNVNLNMIVLVMNSLR